MKLIWMHADDISINLNNITYVEEHDHESINIYFVGEETGLKIKMNIATFQKRMAGM